MRSPDLSSILRHGALLLLLTLPQARAATERQRRLQSVPSVLNTTILAAEVASTFITGSKPNASFIAEAQAPTTSTTAATASGSRNSTITANATALALPRSATPKGPSRNDTTVVTPPPAATAPASPTTAAPAVPAAATPPAHPAAAAAPPASGATVVSSNASASLPPVCQPMLGGCLTAKLFPLLRTAHNASAEEGVKDAEVLAFCADPCGFRFTERAQAVLMGRCFEDKPAGGATVATPHQTLRRRAAAVANDNSPSSSDDSEDPRVRFLGERAGVALGCTADLYGEMCALKRGCSFWKSCCFSSWLSLAMLGGFEATASFFHDLETVCPGATRSLKRGGCV